MHYLATLPLRAGKAREKHLIFVKNGKLNEQLGEEIAHALGVSISFE